MVGICRLDTQRKQAQQAQSTASAAALLPLDRTMRYKLGSDRARLKKIASMQRKAEVKAEIIPEYLPYLQGQMQAGAGDEVLTQVMVWALDANALETFSELARYAIHNGVAMPTEFARPLGAWLVESTAKFVLKLVDGTISGEAIGYANVTEMRDLALWLENETASMDMHDEVRAKMHRACGEILFSESPVLALEHFENALSLDSHIRVKTRIKALKEQLAAKNSPALTESQHPQGQSADGDPSVSSDETLEPVAVLLDLEVSA